jgi:adenylate cyclase
VVAQIEDSDVAEVQRQYGVSWPWPLAYNALMVRVIDEAGAAALMVDILHLDRGAGPDDVPDSEKLDDVAKQRRAGEAALAEEYGEALRAFGKAALAFELSARPRYDVAARRAAALARLGGLAGAPPPDATRRTGAELPVRRVAEGAAVLGFSNAPDSLDGVVRRAALVGRWIDRPVVSLPLATAQIQAGEGASLVQDGAVLRVGGARQALNPDGSMLVTVHAGGVRGGYDRVSPQQLLTWAGALEEGGSVPAEARAALEGRIVVLGLNIAGIKDVVASPLGGTLDGPVFQAMVLDNVLHGDGRVRAPRGTNLVLLGLLAVVAGALGAAARGRLLPHLPTLLLGAAVVFFAYGRFEAGTSLDLFTPLLGLGLTWGGTSALRALTEGRRNRWLQGTFGRYMAPSIIEALKRDPSLLELGGREREVTVLFSDVAGFTGMSAQLEASQIVRLLNRYLTSHCAAVLDAGGVVDKFEGDAVMAFYGDPVTQPDHATRACRTALRVQAELPALRPTLEALGLDDFTVRIGLNTGRAVVGNMGSEQRFDYTCMGDTVNLASRLEGAGKAFGAAVLAGPDTVSAAGDAVLCKPLGDVVVVGREAPVAVAEVLALRDTASAEVVGHVQAFGRALDAAREGRLDDARAALDEAEGLRPGDGPCRWFRGVLAALDGRAWDGVTVLRAK